MFVVGGESLIDLVPEKERLNGIIRMQAHAGGSPFNCAMALSKLGNETGFMCPVSKDGFGEYLMAPLEAAGVKQLVKERVDAPTSLAVVSLNEKGQAEYAFHRGADRAFSKQSLIASLPENPKLFQIGGFCSVEPEDTPVWLEVAAEAKKRGAVISIDPNVRPSLVSDRDAYMERLDALIYASQLIKISDEDLAALDSTLSIEAHVAQMLALPRCELVVVTMGEKGARGFTKKAEASGAVYAPPVFGDTVGAGDTLMAGILSRLNEHGVLKTDALKEIDADMLGDVLRFGAVAAGINCAATGCHPPSRTEVDAILNA